MKSDRVEMASSRALAIGRHSYCSVESILNHRRDETSCGHCERPNRGRARQQSRCLLLPVIAERKLRCGLIRPWRSSTSYDGRCWPRPSASSSSRAGSMPWRRGTAPTARGSRRVARPGEREGSDASGGRRAVPCRQRHDDDALEHRRSAPRARRTHRRGRPTTALTVQACRNGPRGSLGCQDSMSREVDGLGVVIGAPPKSVFVFLILIAAAVSQ